jgi:hypothetical protein
MKPMEQPSASPPTPEKKAAVLQRLRQRFAHIPPGVNLAAELIAERRRQAAEE